MYFNDNIFVGYIWPYASSVMETELLKVSVQNRHWFFWQLECGCLCLAQSQLWQAHQRSAVPKSEQ